MMKSVCSFCRVPLEGADIIWNDQCFCSVECSLFAENAELKTEVENLQGELKRLKDE